MGLWDDISGYFGGGPDYSYGEPDIGAEIWPTDYSYGEPDIGAEIGGYDVPWYGSLWGAFKEAGTQLIKSPLLPSLIRRDKGNLQESFPRLGITPGYDRMDSQLYTPYPRADTGSRPISVGAMPGGISPTILLIGAGAAVFLILRRKK